MPIRRLSEVHWQDTGPARVFLEQIGHNVVLGRFCVMVAQVGISVSTTLEDFVRGRPLGLGKQAAIISNQPLRCLEAPLSQSKGSFRQRAMLKKSAREEG